MSIHYWDEQEAAGTVVAFGLNGEHRYQITSVAECHGYRCPVGDDCVAMLELTSVDHPRLGFDEVHVAVDLDVSTLGKAVV